MTKTKTKQEYIDIIRKRCIEADESILDLVEGCEVKSNKWSFQFPKAWITSICYEDNPEDVEYYCAGRKGTIKKSDITKIIGRKIGIPEILYAIPESKNIHISAWTGLFSVWSRALNEMVSQHISWNLKETLENQDLPTLKFVADLL